MEETKLNKDILKIIYDHAEQSYPEECCGIVYGSQIRPCKNIQNYLHKKNPAKYPRNARKGYTMAFDDQVFFSKNINNFPVNSIIYHSHPDVGAYFSDEDYSRAVYDGQLIYPVDYLVVSTKKDGVDEAILFRFDGKEFNSIVQFTPTEAESLANL